MKEKKDGAPWDRAAVAPGELSASELGHPRDEWHFAAAAGQKGESGTRPGVAPCRTTRSPLGQSRSGQTRGQIEPGGTQSYLAWRASLAPSPASVKLCPVLSQILRI